MVRQFEPVLNGTVPVLFSAEKNLSVQFLVLKKWGENWTELNFSNTNWKYHYYPRALSLDISLLLLGDFIRNIIIISGGSH